jgi:argininosuccinate lyase
MVKEVLHMSDGSSTSIRERLKADPAGPMRRESLIKLNDELRYCFHHEMHVHLAHGLMLVRQGIVKAEDMRKVLAVVLELLEKGPELVGIVNDGNDMYTHVERFIIKRLGPDVGGRLHTARSRNDLHITNWRLAMREHLIRVLERVGDFRKIVLGLAEKYADTVMPGYTHFMHAQPVTFGYYMLAAADMLGRDYRRLRASLVTNDCSPLGSAALTTTGFPIDREWTASAIGFADLLEVGYDGVSSRDDLLEAAAALAVLMTSVSRICVDLENWTTFEYGFIELDDAYSSVSSIMPQKKNPAPLEAAKAYAGHVIGALVGSLTAVKSSSFSDVLDGAGYNNHQIMDAIETVDLTLDMLSGTLSTLTVYPERMRRFAAEGFGTATELADAIVRETGLSFRMAHNIVATVVRKKIEAGKLAVDITAADVEDEARAHFGLTLKINADRITEALDPASNVRIRTVTGGPNPDNVRRAVVQRQEKLAADRADLMAVKHRISLAYARLVEDARAFAAGR